MWRKTLDLPTQAREQLVDITAEVRRAVADSGVRDGLCLVVSPHTTAGVTVNEGYDPDVAHDLLVALERVVPHNASYRHAEGNSAAHVKTTMVGSSQTLLVADGELLLGTWQAVWLCEFDGPRQRRIVVAVLEGRS